MKAEDVSKLEVQGPVPEETIKANLALPTSAVLLMVLERVPPVAPLLSVAVSGGALAPGFADLASYSHLQTDAISLGVFRRQGKCYPSKLFIRGGGEGSDC